MTDEQQNNTQGDDNEKTEREEFVQKRSTRRKFRYESQKLKIFIIQFLFCCCLIELFFLLSFLINKNYSIEVQRSALEFKECSYIDYSFANVNNAFRQICIDRELRIGDISGEEYFMTKIPSLAESINEFASVNII
jgi:hypothetical protein